MRQEIMRRPLENFDFAIRETTTARSRSTALRLGREDLLTVEDHSFRSNLVDIEAILSRSAVEDNVMEIATTNYL
jgi:hypothetical protein